MKERTEEGRKLKKEGKKEKIKERKKYNHRNNNWLVVWVLWHINLCRLVKAKSIYANNQFYFKQFSLA